jgi:hypothetical protein
MFGVVPCTDGYFWLVSIFVEHPIPQHCAVNGEERGRLVTVTTCVTLLFGTVLVAVVEQLHLDNS